VSGRLPATVVAIALPAALLVLSSLSLVTAQHRARGLFVDLGRLQHQAKNLEAEGNRLRIDLGKASQPAAVTAAARGLGMRPADPKQTVFLPAPGPEELAAVAGEVRR
jgi:cell division protein FtsL